MDFTAKKRVKSPELIANPVSRFLLFWIIPLFRKGSKEDLTIDDLYDHRPEDDAGTLGYSMEKKWEEECQYAKQRGEKPSLLRTLRKLHIGGFVILGFFVAIDELVLKIGQALILRRLLHSFSENAKLEKDVELMQCVYTTGLVLMTAAHSIMFHKIVVGLVHLAMKARVGTSSVIYRKVLRLRKSLQSEDANVGKLINMLTSDVNSFDKCIFHVHQIFVSPLQLILLSYLMWSELGVSSMAGVGMVLTILIPLQVIVGRLSIKYRTQVVKGTDERGRILYELIMGVRIIKTYAWEKPFSLVINKLRKLEIVAVRKAAYLRCAFLSLTQLSRVTIPFCTFIIYVSLGNPLTAEKVYFTLALYTILLQGMAQRIPVAVATLGELFVSIRRIETLLLLEEQTPYEPKAILPLNNKRRSAGDENTITNSLEARIFMDSVTATWTDERVTLDDISLDVSGNRLIIVIGPVGSGKSSLLNILISELPIKSGKVKVNGNISYATQEVWIFSGNVRQNILFGSTYDEARYNRTIRACALEEDLKQLPDGDDTIVGERGVTLSGGQKARVNLARALYRKADIYLMDDPLSAVDSLVSRHLFENCIKIFLEGNLRILITHQIQYLPEADHIVVLNEHGQMISQGNYEALVAEGIDFVGLLVNPNDKSPDKIRNPKVSFKTNIQSKETLDLSTSSNGIIKEKPKLKAEAMYRGSVSAKTYWEYFRSGNSRVELSFIVMGFIMSQGVVSFTHVWLSVWTNEVSRRSLPPPSSPTASSNSGLSGYSDQTYITVYTSCVIGLVGLISVRAVLFFHYCMSISTNLHNNMFAALIRAPVQFFDDNPSGRIMNRFTKDLNSIDEKLPMAFFDCIVISFLILGIIILVVTTNYYIAVPSALLIFGLWWLRGFYVKTARDLNRLESIAKSPTFSHLTASIEGLTTIRALGVQEKLIEQFDSIQNIHSSVFYLITICNRWFAIWLDLVCVLFLICVSFGFLITSEVGNIGMAISLSLALMGTSQWGMRLSAETENYMTSFERGLEYCRIVPEPPLDSDKENKPPQGWPSSGSIRFCDVRLSYSEPPNQNYVLKNVSFEIKAKEKIGIVGRTGAGKSSIIQALFRLTESSGDIFIDDVSIKQIGLHDLRKNISIIPQDPVLFSGTMRYNLDPFEQFDDHELWQVLKEVNLGDAVPSLDFKVSDAGGNFSVGQRQLVCLARAVLRRNRIIVLDEATANVDNSTDALIQSEIRLKFADCTIITIAHRLESIIDSDRILVLENGCAKEFDTPENLLRNPDGLFSSMIKQVGSVGEVNLRKQATTVELTETIQS